MALLRLAKPPIVLAEMLAGLAGALVASPALPSLSVLGGLAFCLTTTAAGAAMANSLLEESSDRRMSRLASRSSAIVQAGHRTATGFALVLTIAGLATASICFSLLTLLLLAGALTAYVGLYTLLLKHRTPWSVLAGGIAGALPPLVGAAAVTGDLSWAVLLLALLIYIWQFPHFWLLALHHLGQYRLADIPVLPLTHGPTLTERLSLLTAILLIPITAFFSHAAHLAGPWPALLLLASVWFMATCRQALRPTGTPLAGYRASLVHMGLTLTAIVSARLLALLS
jgi:protoheme IX farnesyltransferase